MNGRLGDRKRKGELQWGGGGGGRNILLANRTQLIPVDFLFLLLAAGLSAVTIGKYELIQYSDNKEDPSLRVKGNSQNRVQ